MLTKEQRELRKGYLGSSDLPAIVGVDQWRSPSDVWLEKTGQIEIEEKQTGPQGFGKAFESAVLDHFAEKQGVTLARDVFFANGMFCANLDGLISGSSPEVVEAKTTGIGEDWGATGTDEIPERVLIQVHEQMYVVSHATGKDCRIAWVPVLLPAFRHLEIRIYQIHRNDELTETAIAIGSQFWNQHVLTNTPPQNFQPSLDVVKRVRRIPEKTVSVADQFVIDWNTAAAAATAAKKQAEEKQAALLAVLGDAEAGEWSGGMVTYFLQQRKGYTVEPASYRVLRRKKNS